MRKTYIAREFLFNSKTKYKVNGHRIIYGTNANDINNNSMYIIQSHD